MFRKETDSLGGVHWYLPWRPYSVFRRGAKWQSWVLDFWPFFRVGKDHRGAWSVHVFRRRVMGKNAAPSAPEQTGD